MIFAILCILSFALQNTCCKEYGNRYPATVRAQAAMIVPSLAVVTVIMAALGGVQPLSPRGYLIAAAFGLFFVVTLSAMTLAMNSGHMGVTLLIQNASLMVPTVYGMLAWGERLTPFKGVGILLILALLALSAFSGDSVSGTVKHFNRRRWILLTAIAFSGDGMLGILQGMMSRECASASSVTFTFWTSVFSMVIALGMLAFYRLRSGPAPLAGGSSEWLKFAALCLGIGVGTAGGNSLTILALTQLPGVVLFPLRQGGLVLVMWVVGILLYREKVNRRGLAMLAVGMAGLILINLG